MRGRKRGEREGKGEEGGGEPVVVAASDGEKTTWGAVGN